MNESPINEVGPSALGVLVYMVNLRVLPKHIPSTDLALLLVSRIDQITLEIVKSSLRIFRNEVQQRCHLCNKEGMAAFTEKRKPDFRDQ